MSFLRKQESIAFLFILIDPGSLQRRAVKPGMTKIMNNNKGSLVTSGELARLSNTTKRTIHFYSELGILRPVKTNSKGYRFYEERQVLDYQMILLLTTLGIPLGDIKRFLRSRKGRLPQLFAEKQAGIGQQIRELQFHFDNLEQFQKNLIANGTLVDPKIITMKPFGVYYIERVGAYAEIEKLCEGLKDMFVNPKDLTTLAIFHNPTYQPKKSLIWIGVLAKSGIRVRKEFANEVKYTKFTPGRLITYTHHGSGSLLSLFWKELEKYCELKKIKVRKDVPDFEIYRRVSPDPTKQFFEIYLPIE
jgi:DNA-binding transcriptional MerR regulator